MPPDTFLLPCPYCGQPARTYRYHSDSSRFYYGCSNLICPGNLTFASGQESEAAAAWNTRATSDLEKALNYYRSALAHKRPDFVPSRVRLPAPVMGDGIFRSTFADIGEHDCQSNQWGAISVIATNGQSLGIKPAEFEVIQWRENQ